MIEKPLTPELTAVGCDTFIEFRFDFIVGNIDEMIGMGKRCFHVRVDQGSDSNGYSG